MSAVSAEPQAKGAEEKITEQASYDQILDSPAKYRNLELREQDLRNSLSQCNLSKRNWPMTKNITSNCAMHSTLNWYRCEGSVATGRDEVRRTLENIKPKQAKALILEMLDKKEIDEVVTLLASMPDAKRPRFSVNSKPPTNWKN